MPDLTAWLTDPHPGRGVHLAVDDGAWQFVSYPELALEARRAGAALVDAGVRPGDVICLLMPTGLPYLAAFFGAWVAGATPCPVAPPAFQARSEYQTHVANVLRKAAPTLVVASEEYTSLIGPAMAEAGRSDQPWTYRTGTEEIAPRTPGDIGLLQFTSGSTGSPRGVRASWDNLRANIAMILDEVGWRDGDGTASWLPLHHDMGLIGCLLGTTTAQGNLWLMQPEQFIRRPLQWLACFEPGKACHTATPAFGYAHIVRRVAPTALAALDLSQWRTALVGAESIDPAILASFARLARPAGFTSRVYQPAYGLAEATLAVALRRSYSRGRLLRPDPDSLRFGAEVRVTGSAWLGAARLAARDGWLVGHGLPGPEHGVRVLVLDENGAALPAGCLGEIAVTGPTVTAGYHGGQDSGTTRFLDGELRTGDAGFLLDGDLFVLGRMGDSLKVNGRSVYVEDLDIRASAATGLDRSRLAVVSTYDTGHGAGVVLFAETKAVGAWADAARAALGSQLGPECPIAIVAGPPGMIQRTSSGKPRRRRMWQLFQSGQLPKASVVAEGDAARPTDAVVTG